MTEVSAIDRIDAALTRIERAADARERATTDLRQRHDALRGKVGEAIAALDALGARGG